MKLAKQLVVTSLIAGVSVCLMYEASFAAPAGYQLLVRGGPNVNVGLANVNANVVEVTIVFQRGNRPAGSAGSGLNPGQGSWTDRGVNRDEPNRLIFRTTRAIAQNIKSTLQNAKVTWAFTSNNTGKGYMDVTHFVQVGPKPETTKFD